MGIAASGHLTPIAGALAQEAIDVAVILNALRASVGGRSARVSLHVGNPT
jgi:cation transport ATPase